MKKDGNMARRLFSAVGLGLLACMTLAGCMSMKSTYFPAALETSMEANASAFLYGSFYDGSYKEYVGTVLTSIDGEEPEGSDWSLSVVNYTMYIQPGAHRLVGETKAWKRDTFMKTALVFTTKFDFQYEFKENKVYQLVDLRELKEDIIVKYMDIELRITDNLVLASSKNSKVQLVDGGKYKVVKAN